MSSKTKRLIVDLPENVMINFKVAYIKMGLKQYEAAEEAIKMWTQKAEEKIAQVEAEEE